jgi:hypothetical protein
MGADRFRDTDDAEGPIGGPRVRSRIVRIGAVTIGLGWVISAQGEPFIGQFELKTLDAEAGAFEFQSQNAWAWDQPSRQIDLDDDELLFDENSLFRERYALELEIGLSQRYKMRIGVEAEKERLDEPPNLEQANAFGELELEEIGAELVTILIPREADGAGLGAVVELEGPFDQEGPNNLSLGPILEFQSGQWFAAAVPMAVYAFGGDSEAGEEVDTKWDFAYAAQLMYRFSSTWSAALEGYGTIERLGSSGHASESARRFGDHNQHRAGIVVYYARALGGARTSAIEDENSEQEESPELTIGLGLLEGLNGDTADHTLKLSIEVDF